MNENRPPNWDSINYGYLMVAVNLVRQTLRRHANSSEDNQDDEGTANREAILKQAAEMSAPPAPEQLGNIFKLSPAERDVLLLCVGMEVMPRFRSLCAASQGDKQLLYPTFGLAKAIFPTFDWRVITPDAPLQDWQLIEIKPGPALALCPLQIDKRILGYLLGQSCRDSQLDGIVKPLVVEAIGNEELPPSHQSLAFQIAAFWSEKTAPSLLPIMQLCGNEVVTKRTIAAAAGTLAGRNLCAIAAHALPTTPNELHRIRRRIERECLLNNSVLLLECDEVSSADAAILKAIAQFVENISIPTIIATRSRLSLPQSSLVTFEVPQLTSAEQRTLWQLHLGESASTLNAHVDTLVSHFNLSSDAIQSACTRALSQPSTDLRQALWNTCRAVARPRLDDLAQRLETKATWSDLILPEKQSQLIREIISQVRDRFTVYEKWGFASKNARGLGISALFHGSSGTGKTTAAEIIGSELNLDVYRIDLSAVVSKYIGETEKNLAIIFLLAEAAGVILLFDEADALFGKRGAIKDARDRYANQEVSYLLQRIEAYKGLAILTTNLKDGIDNAFLRRLRFVVEFPFPTYDERLLIWPRAFPSATPTEGLDMEKLAQLSVTGGSIRNISLNAAFIAADAGEFVTMQHILTAARVEYKKLGDSVSKNEIHNWF